VIAAGFFQPLPPRLPPGMQTSVAFDWSGPQIFFWIIAALTVLGALSTVTRKNAIAAVMSLVATFFGLAALYAMLSAHFLAVLQVLVYAGAIMTLFVFVVMVLNRDESEPWALSGGVISKLAGVAALVYAMYWIGNRLGQIQLRSAELPPNEFGTVAQVGSILFTDYLFVFEAVSVLLLIAVIAAVVVARPHREQLGPTEPDTSETTHTTAQSGGTPPGDHA
jgi:NADH-quinone oxidoreductase subunit J